MYKYFKWLGPQVDASGLITWALEKAPYRALSSEHPCYDAQRFSSSKWFLLSSPSGVLLPHPVLFASRLHNCITLRFSCIVLSGADLILELPFLHA